MAHRPPVGEGGGLIASRTERRGRQVDFFHISPHGDIGEMRGRWHHRFGEKGLFVSPTYRSIVLDWFGHVASKKKGSRYKFLTVYRLSVPQGVVDICLKRYEQSPHGFLYQGPRLHGFRDWGDELWIPEEHLGQVRIKGRKTVSYHELCKQYA